MLTTALILLPHHAMAAVASGPAPAQQPAAISGALDRAFGQISGAQGSGSLSLSLQILLIMGLLTILPSLMVLAGRRGWIDVKGHAHASRNARGRSEQRVATPGPVEAQVAEGRHAIDGLTRCHHRTWYR
ncbi:MAG: hypothetical protein V4521_00395, partial [Pseudomonadota bacterium]